MSMSSLLTAIKTRLLEYQNTDLYNVKTWQRGILGPASILPALAILPINESYIIELTNGKYRVQRRITLEAYDTKMDVHAAKDTVETIIHKAINIFKSDLTINGECYYMDIGTENYGEPIETNRGLLQSCTVDITCYQFEEYPELNERTTPTYGISTKDLQDKLLSILKANKSSYSTVKTFLDAPVTPITKAPAIIVGAGSRGHENDRAGWDIITTTFEIGIVTDLMPKEQSLNYNLSIVEKVKDVLQANYDLEGYCDYSMITNISYDTLQSKNKWFYFTTITFETYGRYYYA